MAQARETPIRRRVLDAVLAAPGPIKPYEILALFARQGRPATPPSIYRALSYWTKAGRLHRIESLGAFAACAGHAARHTPAFLICERCGRVEEADLQGLAAAVEQAAGVRGFIVQTLAAEARGRCAACAGGQGA